MIRNTCLAAAFGLMTAVSALAGPQYVDGTGFAVSGYDVVSYFALEQAPVGKAQPEPALGRADLTANYNGATFAFATAANRDAFLADPARYAPHYDGHCAFGVAGGYKVPANPKLWRIVEDRLYLNINAGVARKWERDIPGYEQSAQSAWPDLEPQPASTDRVPRFRATGPVTN
ncbi:hypothetical protein DKT77_05835 [Meridianimarinicoccus roseus]|uniref:YHS domain-containing protein n=1 Tax=Meridianimarinicoccus roseus TaxID=2072018 RepID=A0A2V2LE84_9RHOB|nr:YHS domain-containing (seleno)protein [Meridianimarinicoccus roseus]PWR03382.1 hypothetical protein DKT77_05835 [Meridianimarinicoccus roseus]